MIIYIEPSGREEYRREIIEYYALRKRIFCDQLHWVEEKPFGLEHDRFDDLYNLYILDLDDSSGKVIGGVRLMPTTGPTLMHTVWADMLPHPDDFRSPNIWEATRFCVDQDASSRKSSLANRSTLALALAVIEFAQANGITETIAVCESKFFSMTNVFCGQSEIISRRIDDNGVDICCGLWSMEADRSRIAWARSLIGQEEPVQIRKVA